MSENHIQHNIKFLRSKLGLTQGEFGSLFGVTRDNIASYERGTKPKIDFITRLVNYFQISHDHFIGTRLDGNPVCSDLMYSPVEKPTSVHEPSPEYRAEEPETPRGSGWQNIPVYELDTRSSLASLLQEPHSFQPVDYLAASTLPRCDGGIRISGDSMAPVIQPGDIVFYKQVQDILNAIIWGEIYLLSFELDGDEYVMVKYLYPSDQPGYIRLVSHNPHHAPKEITLSQISALALVKASVRINTLR